MRLREIIETLDAEAIVVSDLELEVKMCCGADRLKSY